MGILTIQAGVPTQIPLVAATSAAIVPGDQSGVPYQGYWAGFDPSWRVEQRTGSPGWNYGSVCQGHNGVKDNPSIPWKVTFSDGTALLESDPLGPYSTPTTGRMQVVIFRGSTAVPWQGAVFDLVQPCSPVGNLLGAIHGSQVVIAWDNPSGTSTLYRVYYDANGTVETHRVALLTNSALTGYVDTLQAVRFDGAGFTPVINYLVVRNCSGGGSSVETPVFNNGTTPPGPFNSELVLKSLTPITALRHERLRR